MVANKQETVDRLLAAPEIRELVAQIQAMPPAQQVKALAFLKQLIALLDQGVSLTNALNQLEQQSIRSAEQDEVPQRD